MIEKLGMRAAEFVGATATKVAKVAEDVAGIEPRRSPIRRVAKVVVPAVAATAAAVAGAAAAVRVGDSATEKSSSARQTKSQPSRGSENGAKKVTEKTREELYELAKKANIPGRASMTKDELAKALKS